MTTEQLMREALRDAVTLFACRCTDSTARLWFHRAQEALSQPTAASGEVERAAWVPHLVDRADGVKGHYAIRRWNPCGYREVWNLHSHRWAAYSDDVMSLEEADSLLRQITIPTVRTTPPASQPQADDKHEREMLEVIDERDRCREWADKLADAIAKHTGQQIGEHSSANNPWHIALDALECHERTSSQPQATQAETAQADWFCGNCGVPVPGPVQKPAQAVELPDERAAFEAWARSIGVGDLRRCTTRTESHYVSPTVTGWWRAWQARAALSARGQGVTGWQPIETAPKDGTSVILFGDGRVSQGEWVTPSNTPRIQYQDGFAPEEVWEDFEPFWSSSDGGFTDEHPPTRWMPLPPPPSINGLEVKT